MTKKLSMKDLETQALNLQARIIELEGLSINMLEHNVKLEARIIKLEENPKPKAKGRDYGPASRNKLDSLTAWRIKFGDRTCFGPDKVTTVALNAEFFGLSRGQVYSLDKYTFQHVTEDSFTEDDIPGVDDVEVDDVEVDDVEVDEE